MTEVRYTLYTYYARTVFAYRGNVVRLNREIESCRPGNFVAIPTDKMLLSNMRKHSSSNWTDSRNNSYKSITNLQV